ncbi:MFS transporter [uncultured Cedecea sp.]|uniref:MFS transporter n=1 Tax=uncultured Cedecea sp. TaxID=988762 RepID=UPI002602EF80|nr:MFS transporter [uncultured Cedecea sp.]
MPVLSLLALALTGFITILTEALPAGLLSQMSQSLAVSEAWIGQTITIYAIGSLVAAIPLTTLTQKSRRRPLLLTALAGFVIANSVTAISTSYFLTMVARFLAGISAGLLWALVAGYAARMVPEQQKGRAIAIAMIGAPLALSLGVPAGAFLSQLLDWRYCFAIMSILAILLMLWVHLKLPDFAGVSTSKTYSIAQVFTLPGIRLILFVVLTFVLAHNILYTYIVPFLASVDMAENTDLVLLLFGLSSFPSIWLVGLLIDHHLRKLTLVCILLFSLAAFLLPFSSQLPTVVYAASAIWGLAFGGAATLFQTALARAAGDCADIAQSMLVTVWNIAIAGGGVAGALVMNNLGVGGFSPALLVLLIVTLVVVWMGKTHGFPAMRETQ